MKKVLITIFIIMFFMLFIPNPIYCVEENTVSNDTLLQEQKEEYGISNFLKESQEYTEELDIQEFFNKSLQGDFNNNKIINIILHLLGKNLKEAIFAISGIMIVVIISSILKAISENLGNETVAKIAYYIQYVLIVTLAMTNFSNIILEIKTTIQNLTSFSNTLLPLLTTLLISSGNIISSSMLEPILLLIITFIGNFVTDVIIPILLVSVSLGIISKVSDKIQIDKLSKYLKKGSVWVLTTILTIFISLASLESNLTSNLDGVTKKAGKSIISATVPVVGNILGDALDTIAGYSNIIKNATGIIGIIIVISICIKPIMNLLAFTITYYIGTALLEPIADKKIISIFEIMADTFKILLGVVFSISVILVMGLAIVIKMGG